MPNVPEEEIDAICADELDKKYQNMKTKPQVHQDAAPKEATRSISSSKAYPKEPVRSTSTLVPKESVRASKESVRSSSAAAPTTSISTSNNQLTKVKSTFITALMYYFLIICYP